MSAGASLKGDRLGRIASANLLPGLRGVASRRAALVLFPVALALGACRDASAPEPTAEVALNVATLEGPTLAYVPIDRISVSCTVTLRALATGEGVAEWTGGTLRFFAGRDRSEALDTLTMSAEETAGFWQGAEVKQGYGLFGRFVLSASVPFAVTAEFAYRPAPRAVPRTTAVSFTCGPTVPDGAAGPAVTSIVVRPGAGSIEPGQTIAIDYSATSEIGVVQAIVDVTGPCQVSDTSAFLLQQRISHTVSVALPRSCNLGAALSVRVTVFDGGLEVASHEIIPPLTLADTVPPTISPWFNGRLEGVRTSPDPDYFVGDILGVYFDAEDNVGVNALVWELAPSGIRDSIRFAHPFTNQILIPVEASWVGGPQRLRLYARDRAGLMSNVYTSPHDIRIHPTIARPARSTAVDGGVNEIAIDSDRGIAYLMQTEKQRVAIFSLATMSVTGHVSLGAQPRDLDLTAGGDSLVVALPGLGALGIIDLRGAIPAMSTIPLLMLDPVIKDVPVSVRALGSGRVFVGLEGPAPGPGRVAEVNLASNSQRALPNPAYAGHWFFERSHDRSTVIFRGLESDVQRYDAIGDLLGPFSALPATWADRRPSLDARGERIAFGVDVMDRSLLPVSRGVRLPAAYTAWTAISPDGAVLYAVSNLDRAIIRHRVDDGTILDRTPNPIWASSIRVTSDGRWVVTYGMGSISVIDMR